MEVLGAVAPLNQFLRDLHGRSVSIARTMQRLVPFPDAVDSLPDADLLDLNVLIKTDHHVLDPISASVEAQARYATSVSLDQARSFYLRQMAEAGAVEIVEPVGSTSVRYPRSGIAPVVVDAAIDGCEPTQLRIVIEDHRDYRSVKVIASYAGFDHRQVFGRFAGWHSGQAPVSLLARPTSLEISTFTSGRNGSTLVLYSTDYACSQTPRLVQRAVVDTRLHELGLTYREPRAGIMFIDTDQFDAETHVLGDHQSSSVTFVGEFQLR